MQLSTPTVSALPVARRADTLDGETEPEAELRRVRAMARWLDSALVDPLLGVLLPGLGDLIGSLLGTYIIAVALRRRVSPVVIARMFLNLGIDAAVGVIPLLGDIADVAYRANLRNVDLLIDRSRTGPEVRATRRDWAILAAAAGVCLLAVAGSAWLTVAVVRALW
jgi:uncharacterized protein DUF4112